MDFGTVFHVLITAIVLLVMISVLVAAHELGHYLFARLFGMGVEEFAIGMGRPRLKVWMRKSYDVEPTSSPAGAESDQFTEQERYDYLTDGSSALQPEPVVTPTPSQVKLSLKETTDFTIRPWPVGGFVRIKGMIPEEDGSETKVPGGFYSKAPWKRFIVLLAGPVFSVLAGIIILFTQTVIIGKRVVTDPVLDKVIAQGPADLAGLKAGDKIVSIEGKEVKTAYDVTESIRSKDGIPLSVTFLRNGSEQTTTITPKLEAEPSAVLGPDGTPTGEVARQAKMQGQWANTRVAVPVGEAFIEAVKVPGQMVAHLARLIPRPKELKENVGGPISIARVTSDAVKFGPAYVIMISALLSISVGIFNLLPIPPLDGGQMLVAVAEALRRGKRLSFKVQGTIAAIGFTMVLMLFATVMFIDVDRLVNPKEPGKVITQEQKDEKK